MLLNSLKAEHHNNPEIICDRLIFHLDHLDALMICTFVDIESLSQQKFRKQSNFYNDNRLGTYDFRRSDIFTAFSTLSDLFLSLMLLFSNLSRESTDRSVDLRRKIEENECNVKS